MNLREEGFNANGQATLTRTQGPGGKPRMLARVLSCRAWLTLSSLHCTVLPGLGDDEGTMTVVMDRATRALRQARAVSGPPEAVVEPSARSLGFQG